MGLSFARSNRCLLVLGLALTVACAAEAQRAARRPGQPILFSSPNGTDVSSNLPSLTAKPPGMMDLANAVQSPAANSSAATENPLPAPAPSISPAQIQQMQRLLDEQQNWALLTPEEILNLPTQEKILAAAGLDVLDQPRNQTVMEEFYERQAQLRTRTNMVNHGAVDAAPQPIVSDSQSLPMSPNLWRSAVGKPASQTLIDQFLNGPTDIRAAADPTKENVRSNTYGLFAPPAGSAPGQTPALNQLQQLLQPHSAPEATTKAPALGSPLLSPASPAANSALGQPLMIPNGASFTPLGAGMSVPTGATPLPGILGPTNAAPLMLAPEWKPQPPPWMSSAPQLGAIPQRKF